MDVVAKLENALVPRLPRKAHTEDNRGSLYNEIVRDP
jgi:hypothetical protein